MSIYGYFHYSFLIELEAIDSSSKSPIVSTINSTAGVYSISLMIFWVAFVIFASNLIVSNSLIDNPFRLLLAKDVYC